VLFRSPIIYLTAHSEESTIERAKFTGPYGYLIKPFDPLILKNTIELALSKHEMEQRLRGVIHGSPIPQFVLDKNHEVIYWNRSLEKYSGIKSKEVIGTKDHWKAFYDKKRPCMVDLLLDGDLEDLSQWYHGKYKKSEVLEDAYEGTDFFPKLGKTGKWLYFTATTIKNFKGEITGAIETLEDVTDRKDAELELKTNEAKFRNILENLQDAYIQSDMYGNVLMASPSAAKMYGYDSPQEMIGIATELLFKNPEINFNA
jgi:PAS domain S-box-containing protein